MKKILVISFFALMLLTTGMVAHPTVTDHSKNINYDPLVDIEVTVEINTIRYLEDEITQSTTLSRETPRNRLIFFKELFNWLRTKDTITEDPPSMYVKISINDVEFTSPLYPNTYYVYEPDFSATLNVPNDVEFVDITIQLWDATEQGDISLDISPVAGKHEAHIVYSIKTGHWTGDDYLEDPSGYGRLNGCDDGSTYEQDLDCELWFDIYQTDYDGDGIPYWAEVHILGTDPMVDDTGIDYSNDGLPIEWEYKWGYDPFTWYDHERLDPDGDGLSNLEEYLTADWGSDPFRKDVFVELAVMQDGPNGEKTYFPDGAIELLYTAFNRKNIVLHIDSGDMGGAESVPFLEDVTFSNIRNLYDEYLQKIGRDGWRQGVFRYALIIYDAPGAIPPGFAFRRNAFVVASQGMEEYALNPYMGSRDVVYASAFMHELGHIFNFRPIPGHNRRSINPWQLFYWRNMAYRSCMNYGWMYQFVDYSDGSGPSPDLNDWERIDYRYFKG